MNNNNNNFWILNAPGSIPKIPGSSTWIASEMQYFSRLIINEIDSKFLINDIQENMDWLNDSMSQIMNEQDPNSYEQMLLLLASPKKSQKQENVDFSNIKNSFPSLVKQGNKSSIAINPIYNEPFQAFQEISSKSPRLSLSSSSSNSQSKRSSSIRLSRAPLSAKQKPSYINAKRIEPTLKPFKLSKSPHHKNSNNAHFYVSPSKNVSNKEKVKKVSRSPLKNITNLKYSSIDLKEKNIKSSVSPIRNYLKKNKNGNKNKKSTENKIIINDSKYKIHKTKNSIDRHHLSREISNIDEVQQILNDLAALKQDDQVDKRSIKLKPESNKNENNYRSSEESIERIIKDSKENIIKEQKFTVYENGTYKRVNNNNANSEEVSYGKSTSFKHNISETKSIFKNNFSVVPEASITPTINVNVNTEISTTSGSSNSNVQKVNNKNGGIISNMNTSTKYDYNALIERLMAPTQSSAAKLKNTTLSPAKQQHHAVSSFTGSFNSSGSSRPTTAERSGPSMVITTSNNTLDTTVTSAIAKTKGTSFSNNARPFVSTCVSSSFATATLAAVQKSSIYYNISPSKTHMIHNNNIGKCGISNRSMSPAKQKQQYHQNNVGSKSAVSPLKPSNNLSRDTRKSPLKLNLGNYRKDWIQETANKNITTTISINKDNNAILPSKIPVINTERKETANDRDKVPNSDDVKMKSFNLQKREAITTDTKTPSRFPVKTDGTSMAYDGRKIVSDTKKSFKKINIDSYKDSIGGGDSNKASSILSNIKKSSDITSISFNNKHSGIDLLTSTPNTSFKRAVTNTAATSNSTISHIFKSKLPNNSNLKYSTVFATTEQTVNNNKSGNNYNITLPEIYSDSSDDEDPKYFANWANSPELIKLLRFQKKNLSPEVLFDKPVSKINLSEIFKNDKNYD